MIFDSHGKPLTRRIGFTGSYEVEREPRTSARLLSLIGCDKIWPDHQDEQEDGKPYEPEA